MKGPRVAVDTITGFVDAVDLNMVAAMTVKVDTAQIEHMEIFAQEKVHPIISKENVNGTLHLELSKCVKQHKEILIDAVVHELKEVKIASAGTVSSASMITSDTIHLINKGLGDLNFLLRSKNIVGEVSSSGDVVLAGECGRLDFLTTSSGDLKAYNLFADTINLVLNGSSVIEVFSNGVLNINFITPGKVQYRGQPTINVVGDGEWIDENL